MSANDWKAHIVDPLEIYPATLDLYATGLAKGITTGWSSLDGLYTVLPGLWTLITGYPGSGKSEFLDALLLNLAALHGWRFCYYSPENLPVELHLAKLLEKKIRKPFFEGPNERMTIEEAGEAALWLREHFAFVRQEDGPRSVDEILRLCFDWIHQSDDDRPAGIVIDPWNELVHRQPSNLREDQYISKSLQTIRHFARRTKCHVFIVAHPKLIDRGNDGRRPVPTLSDISGGAMWWNKSDFGLVVHRDQSEGSQEVNIHVQKARFKHLGKQGLVTLRYDRVTGTYHEPMAASLLPFRHTRERG